MLRKVVVLPAALGPEDHEELAGGDVQVDAIQRPHVAEALGQPADLQLGHLRSVSRRPARDFGIAPPCALLPRMVGVSLPNATPRAAHLGADVPVCAPWPGSAVARIFETSAVASPRAVDP